MASLFDKYIYQTYKGLIKTLDNEPIDGALKPLSDGEGNELPIKVSDTDVEVGFLTSKNVFIEEYGEVIDQNGNWVGPSQGLSGTSGTSGTNGQNGSSGTSGVNGSSGQTGSAGTSGTSGTRGTSGTSGTSGVNGSSGTSGVNGSSGQTGSAGTSGTSGLSGLGLPSKVIYTDNQGWTFDSLNSTNTKTFIFNSAFANTDYATDFIYTTDPGNTSEITSSNSGLIFNIYFRNKTTTSIDVVLTSGSPVSEFVGFTGRLVLIASGESNGSGTSGTSGTSGVTGTSGTSGTSGQNGTSGTTGTSGTSGISQPGTPGTSGTSGTSGTTGAGVAAGGTTGQILSKVDATDYNTTWIDNFTEDVRITVKATEPILKGQAVYISGADGSNALVSLASNTADITSATTIGLALQNFATNDIGQVIIIGQISGINTSAAVAGDPVWLGVNGNLLYGTANKPVAPAHLVYIGVVTRAQLNNGEIEVKVQNGYELAELHDVLITDPQNGQILVYNSTSDLWVNATNTASTSGTSGTSGTTPSGSITTSGPNTIANIWSGTQAQYTALGTYSATTLYFIE